MIPTTAIRILVVDDHPVVRHGLMKVIARQPDMALVGAAADLEIALQLCREGQPDVIVLDLRLPDTPPDEAVIELRMAHPAGRILLLSADEAGDELFRAMEAGAAGCATRTAELEELVTAIRSIHTTGSWLPAGIAEKCRAYRRRARLCESELACLRLLAGGMSVGLIAAELGDTERSLRDRLHLIQKKLGAKNETHMLVTALRRGIVSME